MFSGSAGFVGFTSGFTEEMFDEVTVCEVADSGETGLAILHTMTAILGASLI